jgi:hypothetical protein
MVNAGNLQRADGTLVYVASSERQKLGSLGVNTTTSRIQLVVATITARVDQTTDITVSRVGNPSAFCFVVCV